MGIIFKRARKWGGSYVRKKNRWIKKASDELKKMGQNKDTIDEYEYRRKLIHDELSNLLAAEEKGLIKGKVEGKAEGLTQVATNLLKAGLEKELTVTVTGLSIKKIEKIKENLKLNWVP